MRLIDAEPFDFNKVIIPDGTGSFMRGYGLGAKHVCDEIDAATTIEAVPIKAVSEWLAAYATPPKYALDHFPESGHCLANTRAAAWEHHIRTMMECGLLQEDNHGETGDM